jgi:hypothetical protein
MLLAPIGKVPAAIDMDALAIGIELDISGIGDLVWLAAADGCPEEEEHAAATSASTKEYRTRPRTAARSGLEHARTS